MPARARDGSQSPARPSLPPGLDLLWGRRGSGSRGPQRGLSIDDIAAAAIRVADEEGLEGVSMARVAAEVGFTTMSLYRYVDSKDELLQLMWNASAQGAEELELDGDDWRSRIRAWAIAQRDMMDRHPWITHMPMAAPPMAPNSMRFVELGLQAMDDTGLPDQDKMRIIGLLSSYTLTDARIAYDTARAAAQAPAQWNFEALLRDLVDEQTYPRLYRMAWSEPALGSPSEREEFLWGVDRILDGAQALIDKTARGG